MRQFAAHHYAVAVLMFAVFLVFAAAPSTGRAEVSPEMDRLLDSIVTYRFSQSRADCIAVENGVRAALGNEARLRDIEARFIGILESDNATWECRDFVCRQLNIMGTDLSVPVLAGMLIDDEYSDMARYVLERNLSPAAGRVLRNALPNAKGTVLIGIVNTLGERQDTIAVAAISALVFGDDETLALAAVDALGKMGNNVEAAVTLTRARREGSSAINRAAAEAILRMADDTFGE